MNYKNRHVKLPFFNTKIICSLFKILIIPIIKYNPENYILEIQYKNPQVKQLKQEVVGSLKYIVYNFNWR